MEPATTYFKGSGIRLAIAQWYHDREWAVDNVFVPTDQDPETFPWFAWAGRYDDAGNWMNFRIGVAPAASRLELDAKKRVAETFYGGTQGELWVITLKKSKPLTYEADVQELHETQPRWRHKRTETLVVE